LIKTVRNLLNNSVKNMGAYFYISLAITVSTTVLSNIKKISFWEAMLLLFVIVLKTLGIALIGLILLAIFWQMASHLYRSVKHFKIETFDRGEALSYEDEFGLYSFSITQRGSVIHLYLPCGKNEEHDYVLTPEEKKRILPRIRFYFFPVWYIFVPWFYKFEIVHRK